jgi:hypothetical protein
MTKSVIRLWPWPSTRLPLPDVVTGCGHWDVKDGLLHWSEVKIGERRVAVPEEFWLRELLALDLDSEDAIAKFSTQYGMLDTDLLDVGRRLERDADRDLDDYRLGAKRLRNIARHILAMGGASRRWDEDREADGLDGFDEDGRLRWTVAHLGKALKDLHPRLVAHDVSGFNGSPADLRIGLVSAVAVQVFNFVLDAPHVSLCNWDACPQKEYIFQRGHRSAYGGHKSGSVRFCCPEHAKLAGNKAYRERKRKAKAEQIGEEVKRNDETKQR